MLTKDALEVMTFVLFSIVKFTIFEACGDLLSTRCLSDAVPNNNQCSGLNFAENLTTSLALRKHRFSFPFYFQSVS